ncbi:ATP-binding cassette domain-containing protein [Spirulina sp. CS-785/01]|uniref:ABC transporter ATP-binding protein n=1 Tax=Spirulina sp. CS-785/01 TaxID=3021716 RepID=UPI00232DA482|nr:ATP-binding cassette domain-containing protein [Spirulina sp. CS-785/01]MDB9312752.1 ATP-binding cassette domain-containing protein [Spirulina sp. CS-785/01]
MNTAILEVQQVGQQTDWSSDAILTDVSFTVAKGDRVAIIGASGSGKTTLLRLLNRLTDPTTGQIFLDGQPLTSFPITQLRQQVGLVLQEPKLLGMPVWEAMTYPLVLQKRPKPEIEARVDLVRQQLHIPDEWLDRTELQLSVGQRQLVAIARTLILHPQVLLLDEPTSALDIGTASFLMEQLTHLSQQQNMTILMVNHQLEVVRQFSQRVLYLQHGQLHKDLPANQVNWTALREELTHPDQDDW